MFVTRIKLEILVFLEPYKTCRRFVAKKQKPYPYGLPLVVRHKRKYKKEALDLRFPTLAGI